MSIEGFQASKVDSKDFKIAIVASKFNFDIVHNLIYGAKKAFMESGGSEENLFLLKVPGAFEIPFMVQQIIQVNNYDGVLTLGALIKGDTPHFEYISSATSNAIAQLNLTSNIPISFGVITVNNLQQAETRSSDDNNNKGYETMLALLEMIASLRSL